jgi:hypothetical protein
MQRTVYVLGGAQTKFGELWHSSLTDLVQEVVDGAIKAVKILPTDIDTIVIGNRRTWVRTQARCSPTVRPHCAWKLHVRRVEWPCTRQQHFLKVGVLVRCLSSVPRN